MSNQQSTNIPKCICCKNEPRFEDNSFGKNCLNNENVKTKLCDNEECHNLVTLNSSFCVVHYSNKQKCKECEFLFHPPKFATDYCKNCNDKNNKSKTFKPSTTKNAKNVAFNPALQVKKLPATFAATRNTTVSYSNTVKSNVTTFASLDIQKYVEESEKALDEKTALIAESQKELIRINEIILKQTEINEKNKCLLEEQRLIDEQLEISRKKMEELFKDTQKVAVETLVVKQTKKRQTSVYNLASEIVNKVVTNQEVGTNGKTLVVTNNGLDKQSDNKLDNDPTSWAYIPRNATEQTNCILVNNNTNSCDYQMTTE